MSYKSDIEIAREAKKQPIQEIGEKLGIGYENLLPFGHDKAKISAEFIKAQKGKKDGKPREIDARKEKQDAFMLCGLTAATNDAMIYFKDRHCGDVGGGERGRTYSMWSGGATQPEEKP